ncbi:DUF5330 domain-containing protein [Fulvimarina sp. MAC8]|uniref:DUF5330 domain-containing protein n=1 Tax=Fulvimarina sp. MAC8 TaxID=3162874 RepID=UPI0032F070D5
MIRFLLKTAFVIGIASLFIPGLGSDDEEVTLDPFKSFMGVRAAVEDVMGFCTRAPEACEAGSELGQFALGRVESGLAVALDAANSGSHEDELAENSAPVEPPARPETDWASIDPALLRKLLEAVNENGHLDAQGISPEIVNAVRQAADLAARGEPLDKGLAERFGTMTADTGSAALSISPVPTPRPRPGL